MSERQSSKGCSKKRRTSKGVKRVRRPDHKVVGLIRSRVGDALMNPHVLPEIGQG